MNRVWYRRKDGAETVISDDELVYLIATKYLMPIEDAQSLVDVAPIGHVISTAEADYVVRASDS